MGLLTEMTISYKVDLSAARAGIAELKGLLSQVSTSTKSVSTLATATSDASAAIANMAATTSTSAASVRAMQSQITPLTSLVKGLDATFSSGGKNIVASLRGALTSVQQFGPSVKTFFDGISTSAQTGITSVRSFGSSMASSVGNVKSVLTGGGLSFQQFGSLVREQSLSIAGKLDAGISSGLASMKASMSSAISSLPGLFSRANGAVSSFAGRVGTAFGNTSSAFGNFMGKLGMAGMGVQMVAQTAMGLGSALFSSNAAMEQTSVAFTTMLRSGDAANAMMKNLQKFAAETPFEFPEIANSARKMLAFGFSAQQIMPMLRNVGDAVSALGGGAFEIDRVTLALGQMKGKAKVSAQEMMQLTEVGIPAWDLLAKGMGITTAETMKMSEQGLIPAGKAIDILVSGMGKTFGGGMAAQAQTFNGLLSTFRDNIGAGMRAFTGPLFEQAKGGLLKLGDLVSSKAFQQFATDMGQKVGGALKTVVGFVSQLTSNTQLLTPVLAGLGAILAALVVPAVASLAVSVITATWPFLAIGVAVGGLVASFMALYNNSAPFRSFVDGLRTAIQQLWSIISANFLPTMYQLGSIFQAIGGWLASVFKPVWDQLVVTWQTQLVPAWNDLMKAMQPALPFFQLIGAIIGGVVIVALGLLVGVIVGVVKGFAGLAEGLTQAFGGVVQVISGVLQIIISIIGFFTDLFTGRFDKLGGDLMAIWNGIAMFFRGVWNIIAGVFSGAFKFIWGLVSGFVQAVIGFFQTLFNKLVGHSIIPDMINSIVKFFTDLPGKAASAVGGIIGQVGKVFTDLASQALQWGKNVVNGIADGIKNAASSVKNAVSGVADTVKGWIGWSSPTKYGPGANSDKWAPALMDMMAGGIRGGIPDMESAVADVAGVFAGLDSQSVMTRIGVADTTAPSPVRSRSSSALQSASTAVGGDNHFHIYIGGEEVATATGNAMMRTYRAVSGRRR